VVTEDPRLSLTVKAIFLDNDNELLLSAVSSFEICVKYSLGKFLPKEEPATFIVMRLFCALLILNSALTFQNQWPTLGVRWAPELSVDLAGLLLFLVWATERLFWQGLWVRRLALGVCLLLVAGRYVDVTAPALVGRPVNLYWDVRHLPALLAMFLENVVWSEVLLGFGAVVVAVILVVVALYGAVAVLVDALSDVTTRRWLGALSIVSIVLFVAGRMSPQWEVEHSFARPVTGLLLEQGRLLWVAVGSGRREWLVRESPVVESNLQRLRGGDVYLIFFESYGAVAFDDPRFAEPLAGDRAELQQSLAKQGWQAASARVESSTFGGASWLAHATLLSGLRLQDQGDYEQLLTTGRTVLPDRFTEQGYRCIALLPGLRYEWPEGRFYGFDWIYDARHLRYSGPAYGWWTIPDQFSLYRVHRAEVERNGRPPLLIFFATISSHSPFSPVPPYFADWTQFDRMETAENDRFEPITLQQRVNGEQLGLAYLQSIRYDFNVLGGYLQHYAPPNALFVVLGDHQPPAAVSGRHASWQVPVHVVSRDAMLVQAFVAAGFRAGWTPGGESLGGMEKLNPLLLRILHAD
jgi:hypothetical protein